MSRPCTRPDCTGVIGAQDRCESCGTLADGPPASANNDDNSTVSITGPATSQTDDSATRPSGASPPLGTRATGRHGTQLSVTSRSRMGGGMKDIPPVPIRDPNEAVMAQPRVPEHKRYCAACHKPVGRTGPDGQPGRTQGFCPHCRHRFSFVPSLERGDLVAGRYEILGAIAHGGLGWIYLARDQVIGDDYAERWVVLKGLIDSSDPEAIDSAISERRFLAALDHPNIVQIHDFVRHPDPRTNEPLSYIVMEYVPGKSLRDLRRESTDSNGEHVPLPLSQVLTYMVEILPALGYLHDQGLLFCDFKPDNVIHVESWLKLIDLGAVRRIDDDESPVFGTPGYSITDDEIAEYGPSITSDLYTVARSAAVLAFDFHGFASDYRNSLPTPQQEPLLARYDSFYRFLLRATDTDPARRFVNAEEMREQLIGIRQEVLSAEKGQPHGNNSTLFTSQQESFGSPSPETGEFGAPTGSEIADSLPIPLVDSDDPGAGFLATMSATEPMDVLYELQNAPEDSAEIRMRRVRANLAYSNFKAAAINLDNYEATGERDWRITWWRGIIALHNDDFALAREHFNAVYNTVPGELAPTLALAAACERYGETSQALGIYSRVWQTDRRYVSAAFGQARILAEQKQLQAAIAVLDAVPPASNQYNPAQISTINLRLADHSQHRELTLVRDAADRLAGLDLPLQQRLLLTVRILLACLRQVTHETPHDTSPVLDIPLDERALRLGLERTYRQLARTSSAREQRVGYIDEANNIRPWTMV